MRYCATILAKISPVDVLIILLRKAFQLLFSSWKAFKIGFAACVEKCVFMTDRETAYS